MQFVERNIPVTFEDFDGFDPQTIDKQIKNILLKRRKVLGTSRTIHYLEYMLNIGENQSNLFGHFIIS